MRTAGVVARRIAFGVLGAVLCVGALTAHRHIWRLDMLDLPWGLVLTLAASYLGVRACGLLDRSTVGAVCCAAGWLVMLFYAYGGQPEGDYLIAADWPGYSFLGGGLLAVGAGVVVSSAAPATSAPPSRPSI